MDSAVAEEEETPFFYTNVMEAHLGAFDFTIDFGYRSAEDQASRRFQKVCTVGMSLGHAKSMLPILAKLIAAYEQQFGTIPAPGYEEMSKE
jgi:hypothetical protein